MLNKAYYSKILLLAASVGTITIAGPAPTLAGFEWIPSKKQAPARSESPMQVQQAPIPTVADEQLSPPTPAHPNEIIQVAPQKPAEQAPAALVDDQTIMTPSPFDPAPKAQAQPQQQAQPMPIPDTNYIQTKSAKSAPATSDAPKQTIQRIDFTNKTAADENKKIESLEIKNLKASEEVIDPVMAQKGEENTADKIENAPAKVAQDSEQVETTKSDHMAAPVAPAADTNRPLSLSAYPDTPEKPKLTKNDSATQTPDAFSQAIGFGKDVPLALAVQQIVPSEYAYSFAKSVNPGARVSWTGGEEWNTVLLKALESIGLSIRITDKTVMIIQKEREAVSTSAPIQDNAETLDMNIQSIEPAAGVEQPAPTSQETFDNLKPVSLSPQGASEPKTGKRIVIRDPGETASEQPGTSKSALMQPITDKTATESLSLSNFNVKPLANEQAEAVSKTMWEAQKGDSLKKVIHQWAKTANVDIVWEASHDFTLSESFSSSESLDVALQNLIQSAISHDNAPSFRVLNTNKQSDQMALIIIQDPQPMTEQPAGAAG